MSKKIQSRLEYLRGELRASRISYGELHELQTLAPHIAADDVELLDAAGVPEDKKGWTYTSSATGYMLFKNGVAQGGAGTLGTATHTASGKRKHWRNVQKDSAMFAEQAKTQCDRNNATGK